jgi:hypothetical protein
LKDGERGRNRTYNLLIKSQLLCQLSYAPSFEDCYLLLPAEGKRQQVVWRLLLCRSTQK